MDLPGRQRQINGRRSVGKNAGWLEVVADRLALCRAGRHLAGTNSLRRVRRRAAAGQHEIMNSDLRSNVISLRGGLPCER